MESKSEDPLADDGPTSLDRVRNRWRLLDDRDPQFEDVFHRLTPLGQLLDECRAIDADSALHRDLKLECLLFGVTMRSGDRGIDSSSFPGELRTPEAIEFLVRRTDSPSVIVRALSSHALWIAARQTHGKAGRQACEAYLQWFELAMDRAVQDDSIGWAIQATNALLAGSELALGTNQHDLRVSIATSAVEHSGRAYRAGHGRWTLECAEAVTKFADKLCDIDLQPLLTIVDAMDHDNASSGNFHLARSFVLAGMELRKKIRVPIPPGMGLIRVGQLFECEAEAATRRESGGAIVAAHFYRLALDAYEKAESPQDVQRVRGLLQGATDASMGDLKEIAVTAPIDPEPIRRLLQVLEEREIAECLELIAGGGVWRLNVDALRAQQERFDAEFVLQSLVSHTYLGPEGTTHAPASPEEAERTRFYRAAMIHLGITMQILARAFESLRSRGVGVETFLSHVMRSNLYIDGDRPFLERGIRHFLAGDDLSALHIVVPTLERVVRRMARSIGHPTIRLRRHGTEQISIDTAIEVLEPALDPSLVLELRLVLSEPAGWALRHGIAHGLAPAEAFNPIAGAAVMHLALWLGTLTAQRGPESDTGAQ